MDKGALGNLEVRKAALASRLLDDTNKLEEINLAIQVLKKHEVK